MRSASVTLPAFATNLDHVLGGVGRRRYFEQANERSERQSRADADVWRGRCSDVVVVRTSAYATASA